MAIAFDNSGSGSLASGTPLSSSFTVGSGSNRILIAFFANDDNTGTPSVTYNGVSMTLIGNVQNSGEQVWAYYLLNPASGANTLSASSPTIGQTFYGVWASYSGALQSGQPDSSNSGSSSASNTVTVATTVVATNCWLIGGGFANNGTALTNTSNRTDRVSVQRPGPNDTRALTLADSNGTVSTGSQSIIFTQNGTGTRQNEAWAISIAQSTTVPDTSGFFQLF